MLQSHSKSLRRHDKAEVFANVSAATDAFDFEIPEQSRYSEPNHEQRHGAPGAASGAGTKGNKGASALKVGQNGFVSPSGGVKAIGFWRDLGVQAGNTRQ